MSKIINQRKKNLKRLQKFSEGDLLFLENFKKCNKQAKKFIKDLIKLNPYFWDYGYGLEIEYAYLKGLRETLLKEDLFIGVKRECERIQTCLNLLDIILGRKDCIKLVNSKSIFKDLSKPIRNTKWELIRYVNVRNAKRFLSGSTFDNLMNREGGTNLAKSHVYEEKAWKLYHKMRMNWLRHWWD